MKHYVHIAFDMPFPDGSKSKGDTLMIFKDLPICKLRQMLKMEMESVKGMESKSNAVITSLTEISEDLYNQLMEIPYESNTENSDIEDIAIRQLMQHESYAVEAAAKTHEDKGGGRSAFSFVCGAEWAFNNVKNEIEFSIKEGLKNIVKYLKIFVEKRLDEIRKI